MSAEPPADDESPAVEIAELVRRGEFTAAARRYSQLSGADLITSKLAIDRMAQRHGLAPASGCASYLIVLLTVGGGTVWCLLGLVS